MIAKVGSSWMSEWQTVATVGRHYEGMGEWSLKLIVRGGLSSRQ